MSIRTATLEDVPRLVELGAALHAESPRWSRIPFSPARAAETLTGLILHADGVVYVAERGGQIIGGIAGVGARPVDALRNHFAHRQG